ncbi:long-chain-fatty-acid--CoA ligase 1-like [Pecten maximus]|uniref:long-chain-fatty-acid--CoA ligase 1-like n=1 Tax=Pecten maximus TaxID=6579 RepID=UPI001458A17D|nr:long-chain-fatty-acid--CoA ligase 1-like [Pecten maximus]XP_033743151.1 long-chain-fatty-acid--CoA ligase 1-like [Pecten maximus]XP_033743160.1 long-chain-fatty-acid--CoA ligase 1-like [Pecten maximus]
MLKKTMDCFGHGGGAMVGAATALTAAAATYYLATRAEPMVTSVDLQNQSLIMKDGSRCSHFMKDGKQMEVLYEDVKTTYDCFQRGLRVSNNGPCLGARTGPSKEYEWLSYQQVYDRAIAFGSGLLDVGLRASNDEFVGFYSMNRIEYVVAEQASIMFSMVSVPLYDTLGTTACSFIINQIGITHVVCDKAEKANTLLVSVEKTPSLKCIILIEELTADLVEQAAAANIDIKEFSAIEKLGQTKLQEPKPPLPKDLATVCYTSGTTGDPKGVMLSHQNLISNMSAVAYTALKGVTVTPQDVHLSYLPMAHVFERGMQIVSFMHGAQVGFSRGDVKLLTEDLQALKPTIFITVPRLLNRIYDKILLSVQGSKLKSTLLNLALYAKTSEIKRGVVRRDSIWDQLVFKKVQQTVGGRVKIIITGSAPLGSKVLDFVRASFGCLVLEGYGQTEAAAGITFNVPGETEAGHVGCPLPCNLVKVVDVPEMDYFAADGKGEICAKGDNVFVGYYKNPEKTAETMDADGWLHTGDIGEWLPNGALRIIDRKKNIFKLAQGEYVAAEKIENVYMRSEYVAQAFVEGDSLKPYLMGVIVPDIEVVPAWAAKEGLPTNMEELCSCQELKDVILQDITNVGKSMGLKSFEQVKDIHLHPEPFSMDNNLLTPTFKNKRPNLRKFFKSEITQLYEKHETTS